MKVVKFFIALFVGILGVTSAALAFEKRLAAPADILRLKSDLVQQVIKADVVRMKDIRAVYGDPATITETGRRIVFDYNDLFLEFEKQVLFRKWGHDFSQPQAWSANVKKARTAIEGGQITGTEYTLDRLYKDYKDPTFKVETSGDGELSYYYYGEMKLTFENVYVLKSWKGKKLEAVYNTGVLQAVPEPIPVPAPK
ncbi:MAG: hypothetical protein HQL26_06170 [Candidatus Omnitrophica bacterium]|nr:hypothetical protein [Candidatus Omnitrophota bacterium]